MIRRDRWRRFWRADVQADIDEEMRFHLEERVEALVASGIAPEQARVRASEEFGDQAAVRGAIRRIDERRLGRAARLVWWRDWGSDLRWAVRSLRRTPVVTLTIVLTLALGLGANAAIVGLLDAVYLRQPAGVSEVHGIRRLWFQLQFHNVEGPTYAQGFSYGAFRKVRATVGDRAALTIFRQSDQVPLGPEQDAPSIAVTYADSNYFPLLGVTVARGRTFAPEETRLGTRVPVAIISDRFWRARFAGDPAALGQSLPIGRTSYTIIGVLPAAFQGSELHVSDVWLPIDFVGRGPAWWDDRNVNGMTILLRPRAGVSEPEMAGRIAAVLRDSLRGDTRTSLAALGPLLVSQGPGEASQELRLTLRLAGVAAIVLLIGFANVTNLLMARAAHRRREIAVRLALGISRGRLARLMVTEALLLAGISAAAALATAYWAGTALRNLLLPKMIWSTPPVTMLAALLTLGMALLAGAIIGVLTSSRREQQSLKALRSGSRGDTAQRITLRRALTAAQAAMTVILIAGAALLGTSLRHVEDVDLGYDTPQLYFSYLPTDPPGLQAGLAEVATRLRAQPGVEATSLTSMPPVYGISFTGFTADGSDDPAKGRGAVYSTADSGYFHAMGLRFLQGGTFHSRAASEVIVNQQMATNLWGTGDPIGRCLHFNSMPECWAVTGVVENMVTNRLFETPEPQLYLHGHHLPAETNPFYTVVVRAAPGAEPAERIRAAMLEVFPGSTPWVTSLREILAPQYRPWYLGATLFMLFAGLAAVVAAVGIYSMVAFEVQQRTREFGIRFALGATGAGIVRMVLGDGLRTVAIGAGAGVLLALALGRLVASLLYEVSVTNPLILATVCGAMLTVAAAACLAPAWRAAHLDPVHSLKAE